MSRAERIEAAVEEGLTSHDWYMFNADSGLEYAVEEALETALAASDALLRTDAAVERVARALALDEGWVVEDWHGAFMHPAAKEKCRRMARKAIAALLDGEA